MNLRKIGLILLFTAAAAGAGFLLYRLFFAPAPTVTEPAPEEIPGGPGGGLPTAGEGRPTVPVTPGGFGEAGEVPTAPGAPAISTVAEGGLTRTTVIADSQVVSAAAGAGGDVNYYSRGDGRFYRRNADGTLTALSEKTFPFAENVVWSPGSDKAVIEFPDESKVIYDFEAQRQVTLPRHWEDFSWDGDGQTLAAKSIGTDAENRWLITFNADGSGARLIEPLGNNADKVIVNVSPDAEIIAFANTGDAVGFDTQEILPIGQNQENFKALRVEGFDFQPMWTPDGSSLIYSTASAAGDYRPTLWFVNAKGDAIGRNRTNLGVHTWADKCAFATDTVAYCAVPQDLPQGAGLERDIALGLPDSIMRIDLMTGAVSTVAVPAEPITVSRLTVSPDESRLFLVNAAGVLEEMRLR